VALVAASLLGLRHAADPDHLTAVATLVLGDDGSSRPGEASRRAALLGIAWGAGHASTLLALGLPILLSGARLPDALGRAAEVAIGVVIVALALRLLTRWWRGHFHVHPHAHAGRVHAHPHFHESDAHAGGHAHAHAHDHAPLARSPWGAFGVGLLHGIGGSAGVGVLLVAALPTAASRAAALAVLAGTTALAMGILSATLGQLAARARPGRRLERAIPFVAGLSVAFGAWYALQGAALIP
jgi:cytochrome c biogenesis protein CcdA